MPAILETESLSKKYRVQRNAASTLRQLLLRKFAGKDETYTDVWALRDVTFSLERGRSLGVLGHNGAGKSSLIRLLCGVGRPTMGTIRSNGGIRGLLELGGGFHPDLTGRQNIMTGGLLNGLSRREVRAKEDEIIAFAELENFADQPARTYSTGMYLRLAFASAIHMEIEALAIDEVLAVGDMKFQHKCLDRLRRFRAEGKSLIVASHIFDHVRSLCDEVLVLEGGRVAMRGDVESGIKAYNELLVQKTSKLATELHGQGVQAQALDGRGTRYGTQEASISSVELCDVRGRTIRALHTGETLMIRLEYRLNPYVTDMAISLGVFTDQNIKCFETTMASALSIFGRLPGQGVFICHLPLSLLSGRYYINVGFYPPTCDYVYDYHGELHCIDVVGENAGTNEVSGFIALQPVWSVATDGARRELVS